jgi:hypothetical protein
MAMRIFLLLGLLLLPGEASADSAYQTGSRLCASMQDLKAPPAPGPACADFRAAHVALVAYARDAIGGCGQADQRFGALKESLSRACGSQPGSDGCGQAMVAADADFASLEPGFGAIKARNEKPVLASFPAQGQRIASSCLPLLDAYQQFAYGISGALNDSTRVVQGERSSLRQRVGALLKSRNAAPPSAPASAAVGHPLSN